MAHLSNSQTVLEAHFAKIEEYGAAQGAGDSACANALLECMRAAGAGHFDTIKRLPDGQEAKKGQGGKDHADLAYQRYVDAYSAKDAHKASTLIKGASYFRQAIQAGMVKGLDGERLADDISTVYAKGKAGGRDLKKPLEAFVAVARAQIKSPTQLTRDEILEAMLKPEPKEKETTAHDLVANAEKLLSKALELDQAAEIAHALEATQAALAFLVQGAQPVSVKPASDDVIEGEYEVVTNYLAIAAE